jgi:hypothetical protein
MGFCYSSESTVASKTGIIKDIGRLVHAGY